MRKNQRRREGPVLTPLSKTEREMLICRDKFETRIIFLEQGRPAEYYYERNEECSIVGNIYKGRVLRVLPGLQAAFVNIGLEQGGFLHVRDILTESMTIEDFMNAKRASKHEEAWSEEEAAAAASGSSGKRKDEVKEPRRTIQTLLQQGQEIMVQVEKGPISTKGPRLTGQVSMPSRLLVLIPGALHSGVSHRIANDKERGRLKKLLDQLAPKGFGLIARTSAEGATAEELKPEIQYLLKLWKKVKTDEKKAVSPAVLHAEQGLLQRVVRDLLTKEDRRIIIDAGEESKTIKRWLKSFLSSLQPEIEVYQGKEPLFEVLNLEPEIEKILRPKVWLKCGGYLIIEETEALVVVDVNTGRNVGKQRQDDTILKTNLEAAREIGRQLRLRDLGGIIVLDFIDMRISEHKERVYRELGRALQQDRAKTGIRRLTDLGLIEMTRRRVKGSLLRSLHEPCPMCIGRGWIPSRNTLGLKLHRMLEKARRLTEESSFILEISPYWLDYLGEKTLRDTARQDKIKLAIAAKRDLRPEEMRLVSKRTKVVIIGNVKEEK
ncbi:Rne/Rng family ribonuclease [bacterium]|nr:Rne/Rng family ribonuclease [bacterium]